MKTKYLVEYRTTSKIRTITYVKAYGMHDAIVKASKKLGVVWAFDSITNLGKEQQHEKS